MNQNTRSLRDDFAAISLAGLLSGSANRSPNVVAIQAYEMADAMLRRRIENPGADKFYCPICDKELGPGEVTLDQECAEHKHPVS